LREGQGLDFRCIAASEAQSKVHEYERTDWSSEAVMPGGVGRTWLKLAMNPETSTFSRLHLQLEERP